MPARKPGARPSMREQDDVELFVRHLAGDHAALMELFDRHNQRMYLYCARILNDRLIAADVAQEIWEKIIRMREAGAEPPRRPLGLLLRMARNLCLNQLRSRRKLTPIDEIDEAQHPSVTIREMSHREELIVKALARLPIAQREVLVLNAYSGYGFDEIAEIMKKPVGAIHTTAWRARIRLGKLMMELMEDEIPPGGGDETEENHETR